MRDDLPEGKGAFAQPSFRVSAGHTREIQHMVHHDGRAPGSTRTFSKRGRSARLWSQTWTTACGVPIEFASSTGLLGSTLQPVLLYPPFSQNHRQPQAIQRRTEGIQAAFGANSAMSEAIRLTAHRHTSFRWITPHCFYALLLFGVLKIGENRKFRNFDSEFNQEHTRQLFIWVRTAVTLASSIDIGGTFPNPPHSTAGGYTKFLFTLSL